MKLIVLGNNLTYSEGWPNYLSEQINADLLNLSKPDANNETQILEMHDYLFNNDIKYTDLFIWQLSSCSNPTSYIGPTLNEALTEPCKYYSYITNLEKNKHYNFFTNEDEQLKEIHSLLTTIRKWTYNIIVFRGWKEVISENKIIEFSNLLKESKIDSIKETNLEWCSSRNMFFNTNGIPSQDAQNKFCEEVIIPKIQSLGWN